MPNRDDINTKILVKYLKELSFDESKISQILLDDDPEYSEYEKAFFLMLCFKQYSVIHPMKSGWMQRTIDVYQDNLDRDNGDILELWDESETLPYAKSLQNLVNLGVSEKDLYLIIKETQKNVLANVMEMLDGTFGSDFGLFETEYVNDDLTPKRRIMGLQDDFLDFDNRNKT